MKDVIDYAENPDKTTDQKYLDDDLYRALNYTQNDIKTDKKDVRQYHKLPQE